MIELRTSKFWKASIALGISAFITFSNIYFTQPLLPLFSHEFSLSPFVSSLSIALPLLTFGICFFAYSFFLDSYERKKVVTISIAAGTIVTALAAFAPSYEIFLILRVVQAMFMAAIPMVSMAYIGEEFSKKALTLAVGIYISANTIGGMGGRLISGLLTDLYDWRTAFIAIAVISGLLWLAFIKLLPPSSLFLPKSRNLGKTLLDYQRHIKNKLLVYAYIMGGIHFLVFVGMYNFITYVLSEPPFTVSTKVLGFLFMTYLAGTISSTLAGKLSQYVLQTTCIAIGILLMAIGLVFTLISSIWMIVSGLLLVSFGFFFVHSSLTAWVSQYAHGAKASASGIYLTSYYLGGSLASIYYAFFWDAAGWYGIVASSFMILFVSCYCMYHMVKLEKKEKAAVIQSKVC